VHETMKMKMKKDTMVVLVLVLEPPSLSMGVGRLPRNAWRWLRLPTTTFSHVIGGPGNERNEGVLGDIL
jgi:hypothetical protein